MASGSADASTRKAPQQQCAVLVIVPSVINRIEVPIFSATRKVAECPEDRHVIPGHPPLRDLSALDTEHCPEIKLRVATRRWNGPISPCCVPSYVVHAATRFPSATRSLMVWTESGKTAVSCRRNSLTLIATPSLDTRRCFAMSDSIRRNEVVERIRLTTVPRVKETPDNGLVLLCRYAHAEVPLRRRKLAAS